MMEQMHTRARGPLLGLLLCGGIAWQTAAADVPKSIMNAPPAKHFADSITARLLDPDNSTHLSLTPYESNYIIYSYTTDMNRESLQAYKWGPHARRDEAKIQLSLGFPIYKGIFGPKSVLGASYTQRSWWQAFNSAQSSPFRETNYEPQVFFGFQTDYPLFWGWEMKDVEFGFNHQSNGRASSTSRSWNRLYARTMLKNGNFVIGAKAWYRLPEAGDDDNSDISKYLGYYRLSLGYLLGKNIFSARFYYNWNTGYGSGALGWSYPLANNIRFYTQVFSGYGESLIDYNYRQTRIGMGVMLNDLF